MSPCVLLTLRTASYFGEIFKVSAGDALTSCYLSNRGKETEREVEGLRGGFSTGCLAYDSLAFADNLWRTNFTAVFAITCGLWFIPVIFII